MGVKYRLDLCTDQVWTWGRTGWIIVGHDGWDDFVIDSQQYLLRDDGSSTGWYLRSEIHDWIVSHGATYDLGLDYREGEDNYLAHYDVWINFNDVDLRLLFKLTWGGL